MKKLVVSVTAAAALFAGVTHAGLVGPLWTSTSPGGARVVTYEGIRKVVNQEVHIVKDGNDNAGFSFSFDDATGKLDEEMTFMGWFSSRGPDGEGKYIEIEASNFKVIVPAKGNRFTGNALVQMRYMDWGVYWTGADQPAKYGPDPGPDGLLDFDSYLDPSVEGSLAGNHPKGIIFTGVAEVTGSFDRPMDFRAANPKRPSKVTLRFKFPVDSMPSTTQIVYANYSSAYFSSVTMDAETKELITFSEIQPQYAHLRSADMLRSLNLAPMTFNITY